MIRYTVLVLLFLSLSYSIFGQKGLQIIKTRFGKCKIYEIYAGEYITMKLKGESFYKTYRLDNMNDSLLLCEDSIYIPIKEIKFIKLNNSSHFVRLFSIAGLITSIGYPALNLANNMLLLETIQIDRRAIIISGISFGVFLFLKEIGYKRLRIGNHVIIKTSNLNFRNLNHG
jgi:hypothetical protein